MRSGVSNPVLAVERRSQVLRSLQTTMSQDHLIRGLEVCSKSVHTKYAFQSWHSRVHGYGAEVKHGYDGN